MNTPEVTPRKSSLRKLTPEQVNEIRQAYYKRPTLTELAERFGVSHGAVWQIVNGRTYKEASNG